MEQLFGDMWDDYLKLNPLAQKVYRLFTERGEAVVNDHIALRTFNLPKVNMDRLAKVFVENGYEEKGQYSFEAKKLNAKHYEAKDTRAPKVFISELKVETFSKGLQDKVAHFVDQIDESTLLDSHFVMSGRPWTLSYADYQALLSESEYAAWLAAFGYRPNHFTVYVNALKTLPSIQAVNDFLEEHGVSLNSSGGKIKGTPEEGLVQSSTLANHVVVKFSDGEREIPSCYYEFAQRFPINGSEYTGFIAQSADKIFESTNTSKD
ncbi:MAG: DUF1338 domain-containing protein [Pseudobdellovibrionaceae bacterium]|nr:MAG: DUF1338 domain-containing protein [Pseudobdellovibrionaceae bacterium]